MNLRQLAEQDLAVTLEDSVTGFGWPVTLTDPLGVSANITGQAHDIGQLIDPDTGTPISGRSAAFVVRYSRLLAAGLSDPKGIPDGDSLPWVVAFADINGAPYTFKVLDAERDRVLGTVTLVLGGWIV
jgi:hypothetical protein